MQLWLEQCESWLARQYKTVLGLRLTEGPVQLRWLSADSLTNEVPRQEAQGMVILDSDIGWMLYLLPYKSDRLEHQVNQALGLRSQLLRESNYSENEKVGAKEDADGSWRVGLIWLVKDNEWSIWQDHILKLRRESGMAEEIALDAVKVKSNHVQNSLDAHGLSRLLLHTRALLMQSATTVEAWRSADAQILTELQNFSSGFGAPHARAFAHELEEKAKAYNSSTARPVSSEVRQFRHFRVKHFRNLDHMEVTADQVNNNMAQAIILFGPNGTGKSSFVEAISLAAFGTSRRLEQFLDDKDLTRVKGEHYLGDYLTPLNNQYAKPSFAWGEGVETSLSLNIDEISQRRFDGVVLNQEDSREFTNMSREELATRVLKGYSALADHLSSWLAQEWNRAEEIKKVFTRKHLLNAAIKLSATAYKKLAEGSLQKGLQRPSPEFLGFLRFWGRMSGEDGRYASKLASDWTNQQENAVDRLAGTMAKLQENGASQSQIAQEIQARLNELDGLAKQSGEFRQRLENRIATLRDQIDHALIQIEAWSVWLASNSATAAKPEVDTQVYKAEIERLAKERTEVERDGKALHGRLDLLDQSKQFLSSHWSTQHPNTCPVCNSDVSKRQGIELVVATLQYETNTTIQTLRTRYVEIQNRQKELETKLKATGLSVCPLAAEDQARLKDWLTPFLPDGAVLEDWLISQQHLEQLKVDLTRMRVLPEAPKTYADAKLEAERLAKDFIALAHEADRALEDPQSIGEVKKAFEQRLEKVLKDHLPSTLGKVWGEITLTLTTASWLLPDRPTLKLEQRGKSMSVQTEKSGRYIRYLYNMAERHVLGLAWFFTYYLAKKRFEEAWMLLDDPAQEMDQPSFRELVRFWETLLRLHQKMERSFTMIVTLHQEERALDSARATNGKLYMLGWKNSQQDSSEAPSIKKIVLLAPGFYPLKPEAIFNNAIGSQT